MNTNDPVTFLYLLVDNGLLAEVPASYTETDSSRRPTWLLPIYSERALAVSPLLIDLEAAYEAGALDQVMHYLNALQPALHVSIIETELNLEQIAQHLRRFIFILDPEGKQFTFRYADCTILALLPSVLTPAQWGYMAGPMTRWHIHDRSGTIAQLAAAELIANERNPLCLNRNQLAFLDEASEPDHYITKVKMMRGVEKLPGSTLEQHEWSKLARQAWLTSHKSTSLALLFLIEAAIMTQGEILHISEFKTLLNIDNAGQLRKKLQDLITLNKLPTPAPPENK